MGTKTYDRRCLELAALFLSDEPDLNTEDNRETLASEIQQCIEDEINIMRLQWEKEQEVER